MNIYVSNLDYHTTRDSLHDLFARYGRVTSLKIISDRDTGWSKGFGFVEMSDNKEGQKAVDDLDETEFEGKTIRVSIARPRKEPNSRGYQGGNRANSRWY